jgi:hypothetical protein
MFSDNCAVFNADIFFTFLKKFNPNLTWIRNQRCMKFLKKISPPAGLEPVPPSSEPDVLLTAPRSHSRKVAFFISLVVKVFDRVLTHFLGSNRFLTDLTPTCKAEGIDDAYFIWSIYRDASLKKIKTTVPTSDKKLWAIIDYRRRFLTDLTPTCEAASI